MWGLPAQDGAGPGLVTWSEPQLHCHSLGPVSLLWEQAGSFVHIVLLS